MPTNNNNNPPRLVPINDSWKGMFQIVAVAQGPRSEQPVPASRQHEPPPPARTEALAQTGRSQPPASKPRKS